MGGRLIARILSAAPAVVAGAERLILQPNEDLMWLRGALAELGLALVDQRFTVERGRCFFTDAWAPTAAPAPGLSGADALVGPVLLAAPPEGLRAFLRDEDARLQGILAKVGQLRPEGAERLVAVRAALERLDGLA
jgi:tRNA A22 N-methylase